MTCDWQVAHPQFLLNHLPASHSLLAVNWCDTSAVDLHVGRQRVVLRLGAQCLVEFCRLGFDRSEGGEMVNGTCGGKLCVGDEGTCELVQALS